jgi:HK97 family phage prohead protease
VKRLLCFDAATDGETVVFEDQPTGVDFSVDTESRVITGLAMPYGAIGKSRGQRFRFMPGSIEFARPPIFLRDHDRAQAVGKTVELKDTKAGLVPSFKVAKTPRGDEVLALAADGVLTGLSVGDVEIVDAEPDREGVVNVKKAFAKEISITGFPAFDDARISNVRFHEENSMPCSTCGQVHAAGTPCATPAPTPTPDFSAAIEAGFASLAEKLGAPQGERQIIPAGGSRFTVDEPQPYVFDRQGNLRRGTHDFSSDLFAGWKPLGGGDQAARDRAEAFVREQFAITPTNIAALNPNGNRPDLYVDQLEYQYPIWQSVNKGTLQDITPFVVPKFSSSSGLVADHVTGTEPTPGAFAATTQTITPSAVSGKVEVTREAYDQGGNPQMSGLIWRQMVRGYYEALEAYAVAQFVASAASITDLTITTAAADSTLDQAITSLLVPLQYIRGGDQFRTVFTQVDLYTAMVKAKDSSGRRLYPSVGPQNAVGTVVDGYAALDAHGKRWLPAWALAATSVNAASSYMFNPDKVAGWATPPQQINLEWRVAWVDIGIWGYKAFAFLDFNGVRELVYDPV